MVMESWMRFAPEQTNAATPRLIHSDTRPKVVIDNSTSPRHLGWASCFSPFPLSNAHGSNRVFGLKGRSECRMTYLSEMDLTRPSVSSLSCCTLQVDWQLFTTGSTFLNFVLIFCCCIDGCSQWGMRHDGKTGLCSKCKNCFASPRSLFGVLQPFVVTCFPCVFWRMMCVSYIVQSLWCAHQKRTTKSDWLDSTTPFKVGRWLWPIIQQKCFGSEREIDIVRVDSADVSWAEELLNRS